MTSPQADQTREATLTGGHGQRSVEKCTVMDGRDHSAVYRGHGGELWQQRRANLNLGSFVAAMYVYRLRFLSIVKKGCVEVPTEAVSESGSKGLL